MVGEGGDEMNRVLVCGGRVYADRARVFAVLDRAMIEYGRFTLVQGGADGGDALAVEWARSRKVPYWTFPADWTKHGRGAGPVRNREMLDVAEPFAVIAFPGGRGTADMAKQAQRRYIPVSIITAEESET